MTSLPLLLLLVICVSLPACSPRPLTKKDTANYHFDKELDNVKLLETLTTLSVKDYTLEENNPAQQQKVANNEIKICGGCSSASTLKEVIVGAASGSTFQMDSLSFFAAKDQRRHARSMLGPARHHVEETMVTNSNDTAEDIVEMDYAQPHRKPPIHNEKP